MSYQAFGEDIPRNTCDQVDVDKEIVTDFYNLRRGVVVFWNGHVGIMVDNLNCLHANAYHMNTVIEPLKIIIERLGNNNKIIKIMNFNS